MRAPFTCQGLISHFHPLVPFARAMADAGHEVAFASPTPLIPTIERSGFRAFSSGLAKPTAELSPEVIALRGREEMAFTAGRIRPAQAAAMVSDLLGVTDQWRPDLLVREGGEFGGCIAAERLGIPYAVVEILASGMSDERRSFLSAGLASVLADHGLPPDPGLRILDRQLVLSPFPPSYRQAENLATTVRRYAIRPTPFDQSGDERLPVWAQTLPERPTVFLTLGTAPQFNGRIGIFRAFIDGLADAPVNLLVAIGRNNDPDRFGAMPSNVRIERYIPQTLLFSRCDLIICHAGSGTIMAALSHGLPLVLVPIAADQPENARRCAALGLSLLLNEDALSPSTARAAVLEALDDPSYRSRARDLRAEIEALPWPEHAVTLLEQLIG
jgi:UDP:flavonoid glycosyltransferase YjiC (YdhE family)